MVIAVHYVNYIRYYVTDCHNFGIVIGAYILFVKSILQGSEHAILFVNVPTFLVDKER